MNRVTKEQAKQAFEILHKYIEDKNFASGAYENYLLNWPLSIIFCEDNRDDISSDIIELMAVQSLAKHFDSPYYIRVNDAVDRFKKVVLKHMLDKCD